MAFRGKSHNGELPIAVENPVKTTGYFVNGNDDESLHLPLTFGKKERTADMSNKRLSRMQKALKDRYNKNPGDMKFEFDVAMDMLSEVDNFLGKIQSKRAKAPEGQVKVMRTLVSNLLRQGAITETQAAKARSALRDASAGKPVSASDVNSVERVVTRGVKRGRGSTINRTAEKMEEAKDTKPIPKLNPPSKKTVGGASSKGKSGKNRGRKQKAKSQEAKEVAAELKKVEAKLAKEKKKLKECKSEIKAAKTDVKQVKAAAERSVKAAKTAKKVTNDKSCLVPELKDAGKKTGKKDSTGASILVGQQVLRVGERKTKKNYLWVTGVNKKGNLKTKNYSGVAISNISPENVKVVVRATKNPGYTSNPAPVTNKPGIGTMFKQAGAGITSFLLSGLIHAGVRGLVDKFAPSFSRSNEFLVDTGIGVVAMSGVGMGMSYAVPSTMEGTFSGLGVRLFAHVGRHLKSSAPVAVRQFMGAASTMSLDGILEDDIYDDLGESPMISIDEYEPSGIGSRRLADQPLERGLLS